MSSATETRPPGRTALRSLGKGAELASRARSRADALARLADPAVLVPVEVGTSATGEVTVEYPRVAGIDLAELAQRRQPLALEECVWLGVRVGRALEAMHAAGIVHGDVAPGNVMLARDRAVLVDTMSATIDSERGTPGFRAPERVAGATAPGDVYALGRLLRWCASPEAARRVEAWTAPMVVRDPASRPPMQVAVRALERCARGSPVALPVDDDVVAATRARVSERTERIAAGRPWRARRWAVRAGAAAAVAACAVVIVVAVPRAVDAALPAPSSLATPAGGAGSASPQVDGARPDPADVAVAITTARVEALASGDAEAVQAIPAQNEVGEQLARLADRMANAGLRYEGLSLTEIDASVLDVGDDSATVALEYRLSPHRIVDDETVVAEDAYQQRVEMELAWDGQWSVSGVSARE